MMPTLKPKDAEDVGCVGQWVDSRKQASDDADSFTKSAMTVSRSASSVGPTSKVRRGAAKRRKSAEPTKRASGKKPGGAQSLLPLIKGRHGKQGKAADKAVLSVPPVLGTGRKELSKRRATGSISLTSRSASGGSLGRGGKTGKPKGGKAKDGGKRFSLVRRPASRASSRSVSSPSRGTGRLGGRGRGLRGVKGKKTKGLRGGRSSPNIDRVTLAISALTLAEEEQRSGIWAEEESERDAHLPDYHLLVINILRGQVDVMNARQQSLSEAFMSKQGPGLAFLLGDDPEAALKLIQAQTRSEMQKEMEELASSNAMLRGTLEAVKAELEAKNNEAQSLQDKVNRRLARFEVDCDALRNTVHSEMKTKQLNIDRMKRDLIHQLQVATSALRTPRYDTALRSMQELVQGVRSEIQEHHDAMSKLIVSIEAQDTFVRNKSDTMHSNFPARYREELRKLDADKLLNLLDILSFHEPVVETVGKSLYVLSSSGYSPNVFS